MRTFNPDKYSTQLVICVKMNSQFINTIALFFIHLYDMFSIMQYYLTFCREKTYTMTVKMQRYSKYKYYMPITLWSSFN